jgi:sulfate adenylyltransferase
MKTSLNEPYGGALVQRVTPKTSLTGKDWPVLSVNSITESDFFNICVGSFSPLCGFMGAADFESVCRHNRLASHGNLTWTIPIAFDITEAEYQIVKKNQRVFLKSATNGNLIGFIEPSEIYVHDKSLRIQGTYGVNDPEHPGVKLVQDMGPYLVAGKVTAFEDALAQDPLAYPSGVRARLTEMGISRVAGFQTRNVPHRAHEYLQRVALEVSEGLLVHPVVGWKKQGDFRPEAVKTAYTNFINSYYPRNNVLLAFLNLAMRYAGPKEAVFHAIVRKNYGCSHFVVGRDHAGVGGFYDAYAGHDLVKSLPPLGIDILCLREPFYCAKCEGLASDRSCGHESSYREYISGTKIRRILSKGNDPSHHIFRNEVLESLKSMGTKEIFFE